MSENELTPEERDAFGALPREREPSRLLEERTVAELRERSLLRRAGASRASRILRAGAAAAAAAVLVGGFAAGRVTAPESGVSGGASLKRRCCQRWKSSVSASCLSALWAGAS